MSLGSSKPATTTNNYTSSNDMPDIYKPYFENMMTKAEALSNTPYQTYNGRRIADKDPNTIAARNMIQNIATSGNAGIDEATAMNRDIAGGIDNLIGKDPYQFTAYDYKAPEMYSDTGGAYQYTKPTDYNNTSSAYQFTGYDFAKPEEFTGDNVAKYMSPYMQNVVDAQKAAAAKDYSVANQTRASNAINAGAFGGSRAGVQQAIANNDLMTRNNLLQATGLQNAFDSATGLFEKDRTAKTGYDTSRAADLRAVQNAQSAENINNRNFGYDVFRGNQDATSKYETSQAGENDINRKFGYNAFTDNRTAATDFQNMLAKEQERIQNSQSAENRLTNTFDLGALKDKAGIAGNIADLSERAKNGDLEAAKLLDALGSDQEADAQKGIDLEYQNWLAQRDDPSKKLNDYSAILRGLPISDIGTTTGSSTGTSTGAQPSGIQQLIGFGTSALGLAKGLNP